MNCINFIYHLPYQIFIHGKVIFILNYSIIKAIVLQDKTHKKALGVFDKISP